MGSGSPCTCNTRVCNYHRESSIGFDTEGAKITKTTQTDALVNVLKPFVDAEKSPLSYFKTGIDPNVDGSSRKAFIALREKIQSATQTPGLKITPFCIDIDKSYNTISEKFVAEKYSPIESSSNVYSIISCVLIGILLLIFIGYLVYRCINCPCKKKQEKELQEAEKALEYTT